MTRRGSILAAAQAAGLALVVSAIAWAAPAQAASAAAVRTKTAAAPVVATQAAVKEPETTGATEKASNTLEPNCSQSRRRLWVEGEGWIVRRVTTCY